MNKAIIIFGSSRSEGNTKKAIDALNSDNSMPVMDLSKMRISPYDYEHKNQNDDYLGLMEKILTYDTIILATPVYWYTMSAYMKIFIDRLSDCLGIRKDIGKGLAGKHVFIVASYGTSLPEHFDTPVRETCKYMKMQYGGCFLYYAGKDPALLQQNDQITQFRKTIDSASSKQ
jgi:multimeric flavodoxin WrbA